MDAEVEKRLHAIKSGMDMALAAQGLSRTAKLLMADTRWLCEQLRAAWNEVADKTAGLDLAAKRIEELEALVQATRLRDFE